MVGGRCPVGVGAVHVSEQTLGRAGEVGAEHGEGIAGDLLVEEAVDKIASARRRGDALGEACGGHAGVAAALSRALENLLVLHVGLERVGGRPEHVLAHGGIPIGGLGEGVVVVRHIHLQAETDLLEVGDVGDPLRGQFGLREDGEENSRQDRDDRDDDQEFDESKGSPELFFHHMSIHDPLDLPPR